MTRLELALASGVICATTGAIAVIAGEPGSEDSRVQAERDARAIRSAAERWREEHASERGCPTVSVLVREKLLDREARTDDPWGERYRVVCRNDGVTVSSPGADGRPGTEDDVET